MVTLDCVMKSVKDLEQYFGLSTRQVHLRIDALEPLLHGHLYRGKSNAILLDDYGFALFRRLIELERDQGVASQTAVGLMEKEVEGSSDNRFVARGTADVEPRETDVGVSQSGVVEGYREAVEVLKGHNEFLQRQVENLTQQLQDRDEQLRALMPGRGSSDAGASGNERRERMSRWQALRYVILGR